jgi:hypothetical protein
MECMPAAFITWIKQNSFGGLAIISAEAAVLDPWLCAPGFHRVCLFGLIES